LTAVLSDRSISRLRWLCCLGFLALFAYYIAATLHWPLVWDAQVMHYVRFLLSRGLQPYSEITDMNMPGTYLTEGWAMAIFGWGDLAWRIYEFFLIVVLTASTIVIAGRRRWFAGIFAVAFFLAMHASEGPLFAVERDEVMLVLLVAAVAFFFLAVRRNLSWLMLPCGLLAGLAASLKPTSALLDVALLGMAFVLARRRAHQPPVDFLLWGLLGNFTIVALILNFLERHQALSGFIFVLRTVLPAYGHSDNAQAPHLFRHFMPPELLPLLAIGLIAAVLNRRPADWERLTLWIAVFAGALSYFLQGKGAPYHRYMFVLFLALWIGWELSEAMYRTTALRLTGIFGVLVLFLIVVPYYVHMIHRDAHTGIDPARLSVALDRDLTQLGGDQLQRQVECLDLVNGCLNALYRLRLVGNNGMTGDLLLFDPNGGPATDYYRNWFQLSQNTNPANVIVLGDEWYQGSRPSLDKIDTWPDFAAYLRSEYIPVVERHFEANNTHAYRIYLRKGSAVLAREQANPLK
jgi:hypothetical protein